MRTKENEIQLINETQDKYENLLINKLEESNMVLKSVNFTSPTGTGKTKMMADVIQKMDEEKYFFFITTLSKGQLMLQIKDEIKRYTTKGNFEVFGLNDYTTATRLQEKDIIQLLPNDKKIIWFRDEGHINTNRWAKVLSDRVYKIVNFSATNNRNSDDDIHCNFNHTMMLRTVKQQEGTPEDAIKQLIKVKTQHSSLKSYNPCAIFRILDDDQVQEVEMLCTKYNLKCINITDENYIMKELCEDNNEYDVIINKFKIVEGIDIRRAHVLYMMNEPHNVSTTIQVIGRCRRNALLYRDDIDIMNPKNEKLLCNTRICYVFYKIKGMNINQDENGNLISAFCDMISVQDLIPNISISLKKGVLNNGLTIIESRINEYEYLSGTFKVVIDNKTGFNVLKDEHTSMPFYKSKKEKCSFNKADGYAVLGEIIDSSQLKEKKYKKYDFLATPLKEIKKYWIQNEINGEKYYSNYGIKKLDFSFSINHDEIKEWFKKVYDFENIIKIIKIDKSYVIELKYATGFKYKDDLEFNKAYYNFQQNTFVKIYDSTKFSNIKEAKAVLENISNDLYWKHYLFENIRITDVPIIFDYNDAIIRRNKEIMVIKIKYLDYKLLYLDSCILKYNIETKFISLVISYYERSNISNIEHDNSFSYPLEEINNCIDCKYSFSLPIEIEQKEEIKMDLEESKLSYACYSYFDYSRTINDKESAIIGTDIMKYIYLNDYSKYVFIEDKSVTSKIAKYCKFKRYIANEYEDVIESCKKFFYKKENSFTFNKKCDSALGYLVEYYIKYLLYGEMYINEYINIAKNESHSIDIDENIVIRACMLKYKAMMVDTFGSGVLNSIGTTMFSIDSLKKEDMNSFKSTIISLAENALPFIKEKIIMYDNSMMYDPNLSIRHIAGLADLIDEKTIIDIKCTSAINEKNVMQLLGYYYLSKKRSDLAIRYLIVYDVVMKRYIKIDMEERQVESNY